MTTLTVNGREHILEIPADATLADVLRGSLHLYGVRVSCSEGECGSCTVLVDGEPVTACLMLAMQAEGAEITTIEGLAEPAALHPIQKAFVEEQAFQCGFCTPGFILTAKAFLDEHPDPSDTDIAAAMNGNICRCGSYPFVVRAVHSAARVMRESSVVKAGSR
jgi:aerobic-type carbon monoxide dehydrogenase small subunit (CoxS/CutS family)